MKKQILVEIACLLLIGLFLYTGINKAITFRAFARTIEQAGWLPGQGSLVARVVIVAEIVCALLLLVPVVRRAGLWVAVLLMLTFTGYIGYFLFSSARSPCSCGGVLRQMSWPVHFVFNIFFLALALFALRFDGSYAAGTSRRYAPD